MDRIPLGKADNVGSCNLSACDGQAFQGNCFCDAFCSTVGDCCEDYDFFCADAHDGVCFLDEECASDEYCAFTAENACGSLGTSGGSCEPRPELCQPVSAPVCGCDGVTYDNECLAAADGVNVVAVGPCTDDPDPLLAGSCANQCMSDLPQGDCFCDDVCGEFGDCCEDFDLFCA